MLLRGYLLALCAAASCIGYGLALARLLAIRVNPGDAGILGLFCLAVLGCVLHFFVALSVPVQTAVLAAGIALGGLCWKTLAAEWREDRWWLAAGATAFFHRQAVTLYDNGLYHLQTFRWNSEFPVVIGLANLHHRLAFNSAFFLIAPLDDRLALGWITNLLIVMFVAMSCWSRATRARANPVAFWFLCLAVSLLAAAPQMMSWIGVLNADSFVAVLAIYWFALALSLEEDPRSGVALLVLTAALSFAVKLSAAPLVALTAGAAWIYRSTPQVRLARPMLAAAALIGPWIASGVMLSGCAAFPIPRTCAFDLPWAVSQARAAGEMKGIRINAWMPEAGSEWLNAWIGGTFGSAAGWLFVACGVLAAASAIGGVRTSRHARAVLAGACACVAYWLLTAPIVRFATGYLATAALLCLSIVCAAQFGAAPFARRLAAGVVGAVILSGLPGLVRHGTAWSAPERPPVQAMQGPGERTIWVPAGGDQCWDHALPCTPYLQPEVLDRVRWR
jgi:hypothetical protein